MSGKIRLDLLLVERGLCPSRQRARDAILGGGVTVDGRAAGKPGLPVDPGARVDCRAPAPRYVSRGGLKLEKALALWPIRLEGAVCLDIGASTGGFTDCMLQNGAGKVYAVDVGQGQLAQALRDDPRVVSLEGVNARYLTRTQIPGPVGFASVDVSFISLRHILPPLSALLSPSAQAVCLIKPQFEAGRGKIGKKGVVRDPAVHRQVLEGFMAIAGGAGFSVAGLDYSPVRGPEGNIEYLGWLSLGSAGSAPVDIKALVGRSHRELEGAL